MLNPTVEDIREGVTERWAEVLDGALLQRLITQREYETLTSHIETFVDDTMRVGREERTRYETYNPDVFENDEGWGLYID